MPAVSQCERGKRLSPRGKRSATTFTKLPTDKPSANANNTCVVKS